MDAKVRRNMSDLRKTPWFNKSHGVNIYEQIKESIKAITIRKVLFIMIGTMILTFGVYNIHQQSNVTEGGVIGLVVLLHHVTKIPTAVISPLLDIICYGLAFKYLGVSFLIMSGISSAFVALFYGVWALNPPIIPSLIHYPILAAVIGAMFVGIGVAFIVSQGGSSGGDDALVIIISKKTKYRISQCYIITDTIVLVLSLIYIPITKIIFSLISATLSSCIIDFVLKTMEKAELNRIKKI